MRPFSGLSFPSSNCERSRSLTAKGHWLRATTSRATRRGPVSGGSSAATRSTLSIAVNGYGDFALSKDELEFLIRRQRADGKIMHEYSQTAAAIDWQAFPYMYAAADATPLFLLAVADYVRSSGDVAFLNAHRDAIEKAWAFETDPAHDTDMTDLRQLAGYGLGGGLAERHAPPGDLPCTA